MILEVLDIFTMRLTIASSQANTSDCFHHVNF